MQQIETGKVRGKTKKLKIISQNSKSWNIWVKGKNENSPVSNAQKGK